MDFTELLKLSWQSLLANKLRSILTTLGIIIGVFAIILLVSLGSGLQNYITGQISSLGSNLLFVIPGRVGGARSPGGVTTNKLLVSDANALSLRLKNLASVAPVVQQTTNVRYLNRTDKGVVVGGSTADYTKIVDVTINEGTSFTKAQVDSAAKVVLIGQTVVKDLFPGADPLRKVITIGNGRYTIIGVLGARGSVFGMDQDNTAIIPITSAQQQFNLTNVNLIYLSANSADLVNFVKQQATKILLRRLTIDDFTIQTQESTLSTVTNITNILSIALGGIAAISLLVGGIGVANIMLVSVTERTKEIGLRKALGAQKGDILKQFLMEAVILSVSGGLLGIGLGLAASYGLSLIFVSQVTPWSVFLAFSFSVLVGVVFGMAPAIKASNLSPIEALRYE